MRYTIRHTTRFSYDPPVTESVMEARMQPRSDGQQRCLHFALTTSPSSRVLMYQDHDGNTVHHFTIPGRHARLTVTAEALVECAAPPPLPDAIGLAAWDALDARAGADDCWEFLAPSAFARPTPALTDLARELRLDRRDDPAALLRRLMGEMAARFEYRPETTRVDSPIDEALAARSGVCQDFAHIVIALLRGAGIPARYVSGYLFHHVGAQDRSSSDATHAWVEACLPEIGWVGLDPTNNVLAEERHVRVAVGRDYADVPPTRGVYKGRTAVRSELSVVVRVGPVRSPDGEIVPFTPWLSRDAAAPWVDGESDQQQQQQQ